MPARISNKMQKRILDIVAEGTMAGLKECIPNYENKCPDEYSELEKNEVNHILVVEFEIFKRLVELFSEKSNR